MSGRRSFAPLPTEIPGNASGEGGGGTGTVTDVTGSAPIVITSSPTTTPNVTITAATDVAAGSMSAADKTKLDTFTANAPTNTFQAFLAGPTGLATSQSFATAAPIVVGPSMRLTWTTTVTVIKNGGTTVAGELLQAFATINGANEAGLDVEVEMSPTHVQGLISITASVGGLTTGTGYTPGIKITNVTTPANTFSASDGQLTGYT